MGGAAKYQKKAAPKKEEPKKVAPKKKGEPSEPKDKPDGIVEINFQDKEATSGKTTASTAKQQTP